MQIKKPAVFDKTAGFLLEGLKDIFIRAAYRAYIDYFRANVFLFLEFSCFKINWIHLINFLIKQLTGLDYRCNIKLMLTFVIQRSEIDMKTIPQISEAELEAMKILWDLEKATSAQIIDRLSKSTAWKPKTIQTLITRLTAKGAIKAENTGNKAFQYTPLVSEEDYKVYANNTFLQKIYNGSVNLMLTSFIKERKLSPDEIEGLKKLLGEAE